MLMSTLYLDRKNLAVKLDGHAMALYENDAKRGTVPFKLLDKVVVKGNIHIESRVLCALSENKVDVLFLSARNNARQAMAFSHTHNDVKRRLAQFAIYFKADVRFDLARQLVEAKLAKQRQFLNNALEARPDLRKHCFSAIQTIISIEKKLSVLELSSASTAKLRGYEGSAAAAYFSAYTKLFAESLAFKKRKKRPPTDPVNACLSLAYTLLHFEVVSVCYQVGLEPLLGFYHEPAVGRESLACDLIEPLRPRVDAFVWSLFRERLLREEYFSQDQGRCVLNKTGRKCFYAQYEGFVHPIRRLLRLHGHQFAKFYLESEWDSIL